MKYKGPPKPIPTHREPMSDSTLAVWFIVLAVAFVALLLTGALE
jgi:hypothetical protein